MMAGGGDLEGMVRIRFLTSMSAAVVLLGACVAAHAQGGFPRPPGSIPGIQQPYPNPQPQYPTQQYPAATQPYPAAQPPGTGGQPPACLRLESQLAALDRGPNDPARAAQINRYEDALRRQQGELDRTIVRSRRLGCGNTGFFSLFVNQPAECAPLNRQIQDLHAAIDRLMMELQQTQGGTADRESQRRSVLIALSENNCGPQYRSAANRSPGLFESLFGPGSIVAPGPSDVPLSGTYRTLCVRTCDGYYWPISFSTVPARFAEDERVCQRMCPATPVVLFSHRNPGEDVAQAITASGQVYADMPNAFLYRKQFNSACSCRRTGETWARTLQHLDDTVERGDIVVTEERAKQLSKPREQRPAKAGARDAAPELPGSSPTLAPALRGTNAADSKPVRSVGPTFLPKQ